MRDTIPHRLLRRAADDPSTVAYQAKADGRWQPTTWKAYAEQVRVAARALIALGVPPGGKVAILGFNRPEWVIMDHAAMMAGGAAVGIYTTCSPDEVHYILDHSEASVVLVEDAAQLAKLTPRRAELSRLKAIVMMRGAVPRPGSGQPETIAWDELVAKAATTPEALLDQRLDAIRDDDLATLIYTSGTTGPAKGVMLSHRNLAWTSRMLIDIGGAGSGDVCLSYLPLSHIAEQMATIHMPATAGTTVFFAESIEKLGDNLKEARPTVFFGVPRIWEKLHAVLAGKLAEVTGPKKRLLDWARKVASEVNALHDRGQPIPRWLDAQHRLAVRLVLGKIRAALGLDRARFLVSGAAPIAPEVLAFFTSIDLPLRECYGQSEDSGPTSFNLIGKTKLGTVGSVLPGMECRLANDGEILVRGPNVFMGYYRDPEATAAAVQDGWLCSGDLGALDRDGYLTITGRKKEIIITAGGKNISPKNIETALKQSPIIGEAVVIGDRRKFLTVLVTIDEAAALKLLPPGTTGPALIEAPALRSAIQGQVDQVNETLARVEQVKKFAILARPFGIDSGELTPTMKLKRTAIAQIYAREIEAMYTDAD